MEFTKEISFNEKLTENKVAKINYHGKLLDTKTDKISIVYGFGQNWDYTSEKAMEKTDNGYEVDIPMKDYDTFNFCFKDGNNNWDNNSQFNYISPIEKDSHGSTGTGSGGKKDDKDEVDLNEDSIKEQNTEVLDETSEEDAIKLFDELFPSEGEETSSEDSVDESTNVDLINIEKELTKIFDELFDSEDIEKGDNISISKNVDTQVDECSTEVNREDVEVAVNQLFEEAFQDNESQVQYSDTAEADFQENDSRDEELKKIEAELSQIFDELFSSEEQSIEDNVQLAKKKADEDTTEEDDGLYDIEDIFNILFKKAGYDMDYQTYKAEMMKIQTIHDQELQNIQIQEIEKTGEDMDNLVEEILRPLSEKHNQIEEASNDDVQQSNVDDFEEINVDNIELEDINNYEIADSTKDELQALIEEIDSQIARFEEADEEKQDSRVIEKGTEDIEETIQVPEISGIRLTEDDPDEIEAKVSSSESDVNIDELFDYLKKYDEEDDDEELNNGIDEIEQKISKFSEENEFDDEVEQKQDEEIGADLKVAETEPQDEVEQSIFDKVKKSKEDSVEESQDIAVSSRKLTNFYRIVKRIKLAFIKVFYGIPKMLGKNSSSDNDE